MDSGALLNIKYSRKWEQVLSRYAIPPQFRIIVFSFTMRFHLFSTIVLVCALACVGPDVWAQGLMEAAEKRAKSLLKSGVDTVLIYMPFSLHGSHMISDSSSLENINYVVSKQAGKLVIERLTSESVHYRGKVLTHHAVAKRDSLHIFDFLDKNFKSIFADTLLPGMVKYRFDGKDTLVRNWGSHGSRTELIALTKVSRYSNGFVDFDLYDGIIHNEDYSVREKFESVNYEYNISTAIYKITFLLAKEVSEIRKKYRF